MCFAYSKVRDLNLKPYSPEEAKAAEYLEDLIGLGGGDDPIGFLIASHRELIRQRTILRTKCPEIFNEIALDERDEKQSAEPLLGASEPEVGREEHDLRRMQSMLEILAEDAWLTAEMLNRLQADPPSDVALPAKDWKQSGRIFGVICGGKEYFPRYQFDSSFRPLPIIREVLDAFGPEADGWNIAAWFHFPNGRIVTSGPGEIKAVAPKDALDRRESVLQAIENRTGSYSA